MCFERFALFGNQAADPRPPFMAGESIDRAPTVGFRPGEASCEGDNKKAALTSSFSYRKYDRLFRNQTADPRPRLCAGESID